MRISLETSINKILVILNIVVFGWRFRKNFCHNDSSSDDDALSLLDDMSLWECSHSSCARELFDPGLTRAGELAPSLQLS